MCGGFNSMTEYTEFEGKNVDKALEKASQELNQTIDQLQYDVVSYGSSGIFGLVGVKKAKIRVRTQNGGNPATLQNEAKAQAKGLVSDAFDNEESSETQKAAPRKVQSPDINPADLDQAVKDGCEALQRFVDVISEGATIEAEHSDGRIIFKIESSNSALLIGKRGQTLEAIQYLLEKIINKKNEARIRVLVDVEGYLAARKSNLERLATKMADKAQKASKPVSIGQMNAYDRRIVHLHLKDNHAVRTQSIGDGYYRKLVIFPKKRRRSKT